MITIQDWGVTNENLERCFFIIIIHGNEKFRDYWELGTDVYSDASRNLWRAKILFDVEPSTFVRHVDHHHVDDTRRRIMK